MSTKNLTTGYYRIKDIETTWNGFYIWTQTDRPYVRILFGVNGGAIRWSNVELLMYKDQVPTPDLFFIISGVSLVGK